MFSTKRNRIVNLTVTVGALFYSFSSAYADPRCPNYCIGSTLHQGRWYHGHGDPGCFYSEIQKSPQCNISDINLADAIAGYIYESSDGFITLDFSSGDPEFVDVTVGDISESLQYFVNGREVRFIGSSLQIMKTVWLIEDAGRAIMAGNGRDNVNRIDW